MKDQVLEPEEFGTLGKCYLINGGRWIMRERHKSKTGTRAWGAGESVF